MQRVRMKKIVPIDNLPFPIPQITYDVLGRIIENRFIYTSIIVYYTVSWQGETNILDTYEQTIEDKANVAP